MQSRCFPTLVRWRSTNHQRGRAGAGVDAFEFGAVRSHSRKAVFACGNVAAAIANERIQIDPASAVPLPTERQKPPRCLSQSEVERLVDELPHQYHALMLVGAYAGLRWGEAAGLCRRDIDPLRSRIRVTSTAVGLRDG